MIRRLARGILRDLRIQSRSGYPWLAALAAVSAIVLFGILPGGDSDRLAPFVSLAFSALTTLPFLVLQIQGERREGTFALLDASPLRPHEYLLAKAKSLSVPSMAANTALVLIARGPYFNPIPFWVGLWLSGLCFAFTGFLCVAWGRTPARIWMLSGLAALLLLAPLYPCEAMPASGIGFMHPLAGAALLIRASYTGSTYVAWLLGCLLSLAWIAAALAACRKGFSRLRQVQG